MGLGTGATAAIVGGIGAAGSIGGGLIAANAAGNAASTQANSANYAAQLQYQQEQQALNFEKQVFGIQQQEQSPWLNTGTSAINSLGYLMGLPGAQLGGTNPAFAGGAPQIGGNAPGAGGGFNLSQLLGNGANGGANPVAQMNAYGGNASVASPISGATPIRGPFTLNGPGASGSPFPGGNPDAGTFNPDGLNLSNAQGVRPGQIYPIPSFPGGGAVSVNGQPPNLTVPGSQAANQAAASGGATPSPFGNSYLQPFSNWNQTFQAPTALTEQNDPGYQARLALGQQAIQNSAAAKGGLLSGNTAQALDQFGQDYASNEYGNVYNRALNTYSTNYNQFQQQQATQFNRLAALAGMGQVSAGQLSGANTSAANNLANTLLTSGGQIGQNINNAGAARASGIVGGANALGGAFSGIGGNLSNLFFLNQLLGGGGGGAGAGANYDPLFGSMGT